MPLLPQYTDDADSSVRRRQNEPSDHSVLPYEEAIYPSYHETLAPYVAEMFGTFLLTTTFLCNYAPSSDPVWAATSNGFMVAALNYAFGHISGANLNPSVTISLIFSGRYSVKTAVRLCAAQTLGAILAALLKIHISSVSIDLGPFEGRNWYQVGMVEAVYTALISFTYLNCALSQRNNPTGDQNGFIGLAMGFCYIASGYAARDISHTVTNPAIAIGLTIADSSHGLALQGMWYFLYDIIGAFIGSGLFRLVRPNEMSYKENAIEGESSAEDPVSAIVAAEFIGSFYVVFTKALNRIGKDVTLGPEAWAVAAVLTSLVYSLKGVSGAYFNPAVTIAAMTSGSGHVATRVAGFMVLVQVMAASAAVALYASMAHEGIHISIGQDKHVPMGAIAFAEGSFTFLMCYVVLTSSSYQSASMGPKKRPNNIAGLAYGACHTVGGFAIANISGSLLNPAATFAFGGLNFLNLDFSDQCFVYIFYQIFGGLLASAAFTVTHSYASLNAAHLKDQDYSTPRPAA